MFGNGYSLYRKRTWIQEFLVKIFCNTLNSSRLIWWHYFYINSEIINLKFKASHYIAMTKIRAFTPKTYPVSYVKNVLVFVSLTIIIFQAQAQQTGNSQEKKNAGNGVLLPADTSQQRANAKPVITTQHASNAQQAANGVLPVVAQQKFSLEGAIGYAIANNLQLKQAALTTDLDKELLIQSRFNLFPDFNSQVSQSNSFGRTINPVTNTYTNSSSHFLQGALNGQLVLFGGLQKINLIRENRYLLLSDQSRLEKAKNDLILNVLTYYISILSFEDLIISGQQKSEVSKLQLDNDQKKLDVGNITEGDLLQDKAQYAQDIVNITTYQNNLDIARTNLLQAMNLSLEQPFEVIKPDTLIVEGLHTDYQALDVYNKAKNVLPNIKSEEYAANAAKKALEVARGAYYPSLSLGSSISTVYSPSYKNYPLLTTQPFNDQIKNNLNKYYGLTLNIPIFNGWQTHLQVRRAKIQYEQQLLVTEIARTTLNKTIVQSVIDLRASDKKYQADHSSTEALKKSFYYSQQRYNNGMLNSLDFNLAKSKYTIAEATEIQDKYDFIFKAKVIDFYLGNKITLTQ